MAIYSPLRSRRLASQQTEATQRLITFKLGEESFALPLNQVQKVTTLDCLYGDPTGTGVSLTTYQGQELQVIDVNHRIFGQPPQVWLPTVTTQTQTDTVRYLLVLQSQTNDAEQLERRLVGIPINTPPSIQSLPLSAFQPLSGDYRNQLYCVSGMSNVVPVNALLRRRAFRIEDTEQVQTNLDERQSNRPSIFLLDATSIVHG